MVRRRLAVVTLTVFAVAFAVRMAPTVWTPYPFNPDGFVFAAQARDSIAAGSLVETVEPYGYTFPTLLSIVALVTAVGPLWIAQPTIAFVGAVPSVIAAVLTWQIADRRGTDPSVTAVASLAAGTTLALEGVFLRRTVAVSYEVLGILFVPLVAIAAYRFFRTERRRWGVVTGAFVLVLPITHHLSAIVAALTLTAVCVLAGLETWRRRALSVALLVVVWAYVGAYYWIVDPSYTGEPVEQYGLFVAWIVLLCALAYWLSTAAPAVTRGTLGGGLLFGFAVVVADAVWGVFPGTMAPPSLLLGLLAPLVVLAALGSWGVPNATGPRGPRAVVLALLLAPLVWVGFSLTRGVDPAIEIFVQRGQTFAHLAVVVSAGIGIVDLAGRTTPRARRTVAVSLAVVLCLCALASLPIAFVGLEALSYQGTTTSEEFAAATFATTTLGAEWTSDDHLTRIAGNYYEAGGSSQPAADWLREGGGELHCSTALQSSWQTVGAQQYPGAPVTIPQPAYDAAIDGGHAIYATTGSDPVTIVVPTGTPAC
ncbi:sodium/phosphate symporter [Natronococcus sp. A-GB7]|uniref:sodium/phosphate symporter n=1 Tax=Natronococcus sp. A-GB7 TaxID=3037649 RepID=UPI00241EDC85|nr:sodium/phosphate symporter [Natronococcus sp. A-GB7]MDG5821197.1 sodium/phosphate symporter [Natronococcus sp. A-GB7]